MKNTLVFIAVASCLTATGRAATPPPLPESLLACRKLQDVNERVRCYDTQIAAIVASAGAASAPSNAGSPAPPSSPVASGGPAAAGSAPRSAAAAVASTAPSSAATAAASVPEKSTADQFGREQLPQSARPELQQQAPLLISNITAMRAVPPQSYLISLANGQTWRQEGEGAQTTALFHVGDDVSIKKGTFGSYHMWTAAVGEKNWVRVMRVR